MKTVTLNSPPLTHQPQKEARQDGMPHEERFQVWIGPKRSFWGNFKRTGVNSARFSEFVRALNSHEAADVVVVPASPAVNIAVLLHPESLRGGTGLLSVTETSIECLELLDDRRSGREGGGWMACCCCGCLRWWWFMESDELATDADEAELEREEHGRAWWGGGGGARPRVRDV